MAAQGQTGLAMAHYVDALRSNPDLAEAGERLEALRQAGVPEDDPAYQAAATFVARCQNNSETRSFLDYCCCSVYPGAGSAGIICSIGSLRRSRGIHLTEMRKK